jgi:hypothetical protein
MSRVIPGLPSHKEAHALRASKFLYALEFADGSVKIGVSGVPRARAIELTRQLGLQVVRGHAAPFYGNWHHAAERAALNVARRIAVTSKLHTELFHGLKFGEAATVVSQMARRKYGASLVSPSQTAEGRRAARLRLKQRAALAA